jgi:hypothetical protein
VDRARALRALCGAVLLALAAAGCSESATARCENTETVEGFEPYCPARTSCGAGGFCLVDEGACAEFSPNAPCVLGDEAAFCAADGCQEAVTITGRLQSFRSPDPAGIPERPVEAVDRPWMRESETDALGTFRLDAVRNDELVLRVAGDTQHPPMLSRRLKLSSDDYELNGNEAPLNWPRQLQLNMLAQVLGMTRSPDLGTVILFVGSQPGKHVAGATAAIDGPTERNAVYFDPDAPEAEQVNENETSAKDATVVFVELEPGSYTIQVTGPQGARACRGAGADAPDPVEVEVEAGTVTNASWVVCRPPAN